MTTSIIHIARPAQRTSTLLSFLGVFLGTIFLALMSKIAIPLGTTPIPFTLQTFAVLLIGAFLGSKKGAICVALYLIEGALGLPVFATTVSLSGLTLGYLIGFIISAYSVGYLVEKGRKTNALFSLCAMAIGSLIILICGSLGLSLFFGLKQAFFLGIYPFLVGEALKVVMATFLTTGIWKVLHR